MMKRMMSGLLAAVLLIPVLFGACSGKRPQEQEEEKFYVYYIELGKASLCPVEAVLDNDINDSNLIWSIYTHMMTGGDEANYSSAVPKTAELRDYRYEEGNLILNFSSEYSKLEKKEELLFRAALVRTFTQLPDISTVEIRVEGQPLVIADTIVVGPQRGTDFVDVIGSSLNAYTRTEATLYFSDQTGTRLIPRTRTVTYTNATTLEAQVLNSLIAGPDAEDQDAYRTLPVTTKALSISTVSGVCNVNLSDTMLSEASGVSPEVCIYSIVDSLTEIAGINSVQISINGSSNLMYMDQIDLRENLKRNLDLILTEEELQESREE